MIRYVLLVSCVFVGFLAGACKTARKNYSYGKQVVTPAASQNTDPVANGMAQFFANLYAKNKGDIKKTIAELDASGPEGEAIKKNLTDHLSKIKQINDEHGLNIQFELDAAAAGEELKFISNILADTKFKENVDLVKFLKDNTPVFCVYELADNGFDLERTCINIAAVAADIFGSITSGEFFRDQNILQTVTARVAYKETVDFDKYAQVLAGKTPDEVYQWSKQKLDLLPIENSAIRLVGEAISIRNAWIQAMANGDFDAAERYEQMGWDLRSEQGDYKRVLEYQTRDDQLTVVGRLVRIYNLSFNELKSRVEAYNTSSKSWWQFWK
jgi:hypothetical protein